MEESSNSPEKREKWRECLGGGGGGGREGEKERVTITSEWAVYQYSFMVMTNNSTIV